MLNKRKYIDLAKGLIIAGVCMAAGPIQSIAAERVVAYTSSPESRADIIIDTRSAPLCEAASLPKARCLPALDFFGPHKRLANFSGVLWLLGTAGLTGDEHVLVIGNNSTDKEAVAGLLLIAGQRKITILIPALGALKDIVLSSGETRSKSREQIYQATMRAERIVLRDDMIKLLGTANSPVIFDGRTENEYWGQSMRAQRGGHLPGAQHRPVSLSEIDTPDAFSSPPNSQQLPVSYAHNSYEGLIYLTRLQASGMASRIYLEGWSGWASDGALPADSLTLPDRMLKPRTNKAAASKQAPGKYAWPGKWSWIEYSGFGLGAIALAMGGFFVGRTTIATRG